MESPSDKDWPIRKVDVVDVWRVVRGPLREWVGIVIHHGASNAKAKRRDIQAYANFHVRPVAEGGRGYSDMGYHFGIEEDGGIWISDAGDKARWIWQRPGSHTKATKSLDGKIVMPAGVNSSCVGICFAGNFDEQDLERPAFESGVRLCVELLCVGIRESADVIYPHNRFQEKDCPGKKFPFDEFVKTVSIESRLRAGVKPT